MIFGTSPLKIPRDEKIFARLDKMPKDCMRHLSVSIGKRIVFVIVELIAAEIAVVDKEAFPISCQSICENSVQEKRKEKHLIF